VREWSLSLALSLLLLPLRCVCVCACVRACVRAVVVCGGTLIIEKASTMPMQTLFENHMFPQTFASGLSLPPLASQLPQSGAEEEADPQPPPALALKPARGAALGPHPIAPLCVLVR
jgi:hypothetical protein